AWIFRTLDDAEARLSHDAAGAMERIFALSNHLRDKLQHRLTTGAVVTAGPPSRAWRASRVAVAMFCGYSVYTTFLYNGYDFLAGNPIDWRVDVQMLLGYAVATALWPFVAGTCRRFRVAGPRWKRNAGIIAGACLVHASLVEVSEAGLRLA